MHTLMRPIHLAALIATFVGLIGTGCTPAAAPLPSGSVQFQDDFSRSSSGWEIRRRTDATFEYRDGEYRMLILAAQTSAWSRPGLSLGEVRLEVDARPTGGTPDNLYGFICRYRDDDEYAFLVASSDGFAGIGEVHDGRRVLLSGEAMLPAEAIAPGNLPNHLTAECLADALRLTINGTLVAEVESSSRVPEGDIGLIVGSYADPGIEIAFDNFSALAP